jgi:hypothetical protein
MSWCLASSERSGKNPNLGNVSTGWHAKPRMIGQRKFRP